MKVFFLAAIFALIFFVLWTHVVVIDDHDRRIQVIEKAR